MKKLLIALGTAALLATCSAAYACDHNGSHTGTLGMFAAFKSGDNDNNGGTFAKLSGTGSSFGGTTSTATGSIVAGNDHVNGHWNAALSTTWSSATTKTWTDNDGDADDGTVTVSCAPSTATVTLTNGSTTT